jgi:hypothetical protein
MVLKHTAAVCLALAAVSAAAALGDVQRDSGRATRTRVDHAPYTHHQQTLPSGTQLVQYVDRRAIVFAVTWSGPFLPELREVLGVHHAALVEEQSRGSLHAPIVVRRPDLVIVSAGVPGAFRGYAWLPQRSPAGFDPKELS